MAAETINAVLSGLAGLVLYRILISILEEIYSLIPKWIDYTIIYLGTITVYFLPGTAWKFIFLALWVSIVFLRIDRRLAR